MKIDYDKLNRDSPQQRIFNYTSLSRWSVYIKSFAPDPDLGSNVYILKVMTFTEFLVNIEVITKIPKGGHRFDKISELFKK